MFLKLLVTVTNEKVALQGLSLWDQKLYSYVTIGILWFFTERLFSHMDLFCCCERQITLGLRGTEDPSV